MRIQLSLGYRAVWTDGGHRRSWKVRAEPIPYPNPPFGGCIENPSAKHDQFETNGRVLSFIFSTSTRHPTSKAMEKARLETFTADKWWPHDSVRGHGANSKKVTRTPNLITRINLQKRHCIDGESRFRIYTPTSR